MGCTRARHVSAPGRLIHRFPVALIGTTAERGLRHIRTSAAAASSVAVYGERARDPFRVPDVSADFARNEQLMPRLYGPGHFTEDPYSHLVSPHGIPVDELVSVLQKEIRRSHVDNAVLAAYEMYITSPEVAQHLWRRLRLISVEDVGMGLPLGPVLIDALHGDFDATPGGDWMMACHAVRILAMAPKDRTSSEHADWVATKVALGEALVQVPDYAYCVHTRAGQQLERGLVQWWENGARVNDELPAADHRYRDELIAIHRRDEADNGTAPRAPHWDNPTTPSSG